MDRLLYDRMAGHDTTHWWYCARRDILASVIRRKTALPRMARILEIGCGTGHNLAMLSAFGDVDAVEIDDHSRAIASARLGRDIAASPLPELTGVPEQSYDLIAILDVLEHVEDDRAALKAISRRLRTGGAILITVPQYPWMWSSHDVANHHFRRYTKGTLRKAIDDAGLTLTMLQSFNSILFPLAVADWVVGRIMRRTGSNDVQPALVNALFKIIFRLERYLVGRVPMPPGMSLVALVSAR